MANVALARFALAVAACWSTLVGTAAAQTIHSFCAAAQKPVSDDARLSRAVRATFGEVPFTSSAEACIYPLKVIRYADADVLLTVGKVPGNACHGCGAHLSAYVLRRIDGDLKPAGRFIDFAEVGTFGSPGEISQVELGGDDGLAIENGIFQGHTFTDLDVYVFRAGKAVHLKPVTRLILSADDAGASTDPRTAITVDGTWTVDRTSTSRIHVDYTVKVRGRTTVRHTVWRVSQDRLELEIGAVPPEAVEASGG